MLRAAMKQSGQTSRAAPENNEHNKHNKGPIHIILHSFIRLASLSSFLFSICLCALR